MPDLTDKNAINTFLLFSPSLSPDLFMFLELCLHCLAFIRGDVGHCSAPTHGAVIYSRVRKSTHGGSLSCCNSWSPVVNIFSVKCVFVERFFKEMLKTRR